MTLLPIRLSTVSKLLGISMLLIGAAESHAQACTSLASDPDGDGRGPVLGGVACTVSIAPNGYPYCTNGNYLPAAKEVGMGFEAGRTCTIPSTAPVVGALTVSAIPIPRCGSLASYTATTSSGGKTSHWGWENKRSCAIAMAPNNYPYCTTGNYQTSASSLGWGWDTSSKVPGASFSCVIGGTTAMNPQAPIPTGVIQAIKGQVYSASGKKIVMRGINLQYGDKPLAAIDAIRPLAGVGANTIRLQLTSNTTAAELQAALDKVVANGMLAVLMYWNDNLCTSNYNTITHFGPAMDKWLNEWKPVLSDPLYARYIVLNIANEWGRGATDPQQTEFKNTYIQAIQQLRDAGYTFPLMIDAPQCGQDSTNMAKMAPVIAQADRYRNVIFSAHAYFSYPDKATITTARELMTKTGYPFVWGEFGNDLYVPAGGRPTDYASLMTDANTFGIGYIGWSWFGNGPTTRALDMVNNYVPTGTTGWGANFIKQLNSPAPPEKFIP